MAITRLSIRACALGFAAIIGLSGCTEKSGDAIVLDKEYIPAAEVPPEATPTPSPSPAPSPTPAEPSDEDEVQQARELNPNEIVVDGYVMDKDARGTGKDPRALHNEQWIVRVEMFPHGRRIDVHAEQAQYEKVKPGDRVHITYREGKYTGTAWSAKID